MVADVVVVGAGPGGSVAAATLAEGGEDVLLLDEGRYHALESTAPHSREEMVEKYRNGGLTVTADPANIAYVEGRCVGGGSEVNSGLYHRTPEQVLERWREVYGVEALSREEMRPHFEACEQAVNVSYLPGEPTTASQKLEMGAGELGWDCVEVPRWYEYSGQEDSAGATEGVKQSMTKTYVPRFLKEGGRLEAKTRVKKLSRSNGKWTLKAETYEEGQVVDRHIRADAVFLACGAVHTPALLKRSGIRRNVGKTLNMHPTVKIVAEFEEEVNSLDSGVPVHQVKEFAPGITLGGSASTPPHLAMTLTDADADIGSVGNRWQSMFTYYASVTEGKGRVLNLPFFEDPMVWYSMGEQGYRKLGKGLRRLAELLFTAGAERLYPAINGVPAIEEESQIDRIPRRVSRSDASLMTVHLFSSCPMGENRDECAVNSFGKMHGLENLYVSDGSILCDSPGVNPQGSIMALARRNAIHFLNK